MLSVGIGTTTLASILVTLGSPEVGALAGLLLGGPLAVSASQGSILSDSGKKACEEALSKNWGRIKAQMGRGKQGDDLPANHDLLRAMRKAWLLGVQHCLTKCRSDLETQDDINVALDARIVTGQLGIGSWAPALRYCQIRQLRRFKFCQCNRRVEASKVNHQMGGLTQRPLCIKV